MMNMIRRKLSSMTCVLAIHTFYIQALLPFMFLYRGIHDRSRYETSRCVEISAEWSVFWRSQEQTCVWRVLS
jgi:hypothetical protein